MHIVFEDRDEAGGKLAEKLARFRGTNAVILAIPRGGIPVAAVAANKLQLDWNVIVVRKLPIPWNPEAGFGAVAADGSTVLNEPMVHGLQMSGDQIEEVVNEVRAEVVRRSTVLSDMRPHIDVAGRVVIVIDDGLASGYTMLAAIKSVRAQSAAKIIAASPVASRSAAALIEKAADDCVFEIVSPSVPFAVADYYLVWHDLDDDALLSILRDG